ncbi:MAG TPA: hypothetical protein VGQ47_03325 [Candidatus Limnocylindrales bacterium]|nr:hypothetical protein [Candidatus Limnocylindrales bacterium]
MNAPHGEESGQLGLPWAASSEPVGPTGSQDQPEQDPTGAIGSAPEGRSNGWVLDLTADEFDPPDPPSGDAPASPGESVAAAPGPRMPAAPGPAPVESGFSLVPAWAPRRQLLVDDPNPRRDVDWEHVHMAMPRLLGQPAYVPPRRFFVPSERPLDQDDLPLQAERDDDGFLVGEAAMQAAGDFAEASTGGAFRFSPAPLRTLGSIFRRRQ